jgi:putative sterol carrier protein
MPRNSGAQLTRYRSSRRYLFVAISVLTSMTCIGALTAVSSEHMDSTPQEVFDSMRGNFQASKAKGVHARYQWDLSGPEGGQWWIDVNDGTYKMGKGKIANPNVTFLTKDKDWVAVSNGQLGGTWAYLTGRLKIRGDQALARKLGEMFP